MGKKVVRSSSEGLRPMTADMLDELRKAPKPTSEIKVYAPPELKDVAWARAYESGLSLSEWIVKLVAKEVDRPELGRVPRKPMGRPRSKAASA